MHQRSLLTLLPLALAPLALGACVVQPSLNGKRCDEEHPCITGFACVAGTCLGLTDNEDEEIDDDRNPFETGEGEGEGEGDGKPPVGEGEGEGEPPVGEGEGEGEPPVGEGEGEPPVGEGEGEPPVGEGEGEPPVGEGEGEGEPPLGADDVFPDDGDTLARLELNGSGADASGNGRNASVLDSSPTYVNTAFGKGLVLVDDTSPTGFNWNPHAATLSPPFTFEMVFTPNSVAGLAKIFGHRDDLEAGWYIEDGRVIYQPFVFDVGPPLAANQRVYLTIAVRAANNVDVFINGVLVDNVSLAVGVPPPEAHFFNDNVENLFAPDRTENLSGVLEAVRISSVARTAGEVAVIQDRLQANP